MTHEDIDVGNDMAVDFVVALVVVVVDSTRCVASRLVSPCL